MPQDTFFGVGTFAEKDTIEEGKKKKKNICLEDIYKFLVWKSSKSYSLYKISAEHFGPTQILIKFVDFANSTPFLHISDFHLFMKFTWFFGRSKCALNIFEVQKWREERGAFFQKKKKKA